MFLGAKVRLLSYIASDLTKTLSLFNNKSRAIQVPTHKKGATPTVDAAPCCFNQNVILIMRPQWPW